jgi:hypothetical protein
LVWYWARTKPNQNILVNTKPFGIGLVLVFSHMTGLTVVGSGFRTSNTHLPYRGSYLNTTTKQLPTSTADRSAHR